MPPLPMVLDVLGRVVAPTLFASALTFAAFLFAFRNRASDFGAATAFLAGALVGNAMTDPAMPWRPERFGWNWLFIAAALAMVVELAARGGDVSSVACWVMRALMSGHAAWLLVPTSIRDETVWSVPLFTFVVLIEWDLLERAASQSPGGLYPFAVALVPFGAAAVLIHAHSARLTDVATIISAALLGIAVVAWLQASVISAAMPAVAVVLPGLLLSGYHETYSQVPWQCFTLVALAPIALVLSVVPPMSRLSPFGRRAASVALLMLPVIIAVAWTMSAEPLQFE